MFAYFDRELGEVGSAILLERHYAYGIVEKIVRCRVCGDESRSLGALALARYRAHRCVPARRVVVSV